jgi:hypothetical protein
MNSLKYKAATWLKSQAILVWTSIKAMCVQEANYFLADKEWYRKHTGGTWYQVAPWPAMPYINPFWTRFVVNGERLFAIETYFDDKPVVKLTRSAGMSGISHYGHCGTFGNFYGVPIIGSTSSVTTKFCPNCGKNDRIVTLDA